MNNLFSVTGPLAGEYLTHEALTSGTGAAHAVKLYSVLEEYDSVESLQAVICDNTNVNTGFKTGAVTVLEKMLDRKIHKIGCLLHWNELPLREIIKQLDGKNNSATIWIGPIGSRLSEDLYQEPAVEFKKVSTTMGEPPAEVMEDLSADQKLLLQYVLGIDAGVIPTNVLKLKPGPACLSRWLTMATRILIIYTRTQDPSSELQRIVAFIQQVYAPGWFLVKCQKSFVEGPRVLFKLLQAVRQLNDPLCSAVFEDKLEKWAFSLLSENFLAAMLYSDSTWDRKMAAWKICQLKSQPDTPIGSQRIQTVNINADKWSNLICLSTAEHEPPITKNMSVEEVEAMVDIRGEPPRFPIHTQSVERAVKNTSEAAGSSFSKEARHKAIVVKTKARKERPHTDSKKDFF